MTNEMGIPHERETWLAHYGELKEDTVFSDWDSYTRETTKRTVKAGTTIKIVMVSRFGDVGITDDLSRDYGYQARVDPDQIANLRMEK